MADCSRGSCGPPTNSERGGIGKHGYPAGRFFEEAGIVLVVVLGIAVVINLAAVIVGAG